MKQDKIWEYFQNEDIDSFKGNRPRLKFLLKNFKKGDKILNIGVGNGFLEFLALEYEIDIYCIDPSKKAIERLKENLGDKAYIGYSQSLPFKDNFFDGVVMSEVLEHLNDEIIVQTIKEVNRVLIKNALFIGTVPYKENLNEQKVVCPSCGDIFHRWGHIQSFDESGILNLLSNNFIIKIIKPKMFISWETLNYKGKIGTLFAYLMKLKTRNLNLYFKVVKK
jgi:SAM-dependent methyltransferase